MTYQDGWEVACELNDELRSERDELRDENAFLRRELELSEFYRRFAAGDSYAAAEAFAAGAVEERLERYRAATKGVQSAGV